MRLTQLPSRSRHVCTFLGLETTIGETITRVLWWELGDALFVSTVKFILSFFFIILCELHIFKVMVGLEFIRKLHRLLLEDYRMHSVFII